MATILVTFQMVGTKAMTRHQNVQFSNVSSIWMTGIQIPTKLLLGACLGVLHWTLAKVSLHPFSETGLGPSAETSALKWRFYIASQLKIPNPSDTGFWFRRLDPAGLEGPTVKADSDRLLETQHWISKLMFELLAGLHKPQYWTSMFCSDLK